MSSPRPSHLSKPPHSRWLYNATILAQYNERDATRRPSFITVNALAAGADDLACLRYAVTCVRVIAEKAASCCAVTSRCLINSRTARKVTITSNLLVCAESRSMNVSG